MNLSEFRSSFQGTVTFQCQMSRKKAVDPVLASMAQQAEEKRSKKQKKPVQGRPTFIVGFVDNMAREISN
jgi:hypothetical protein